MSSIKLRRPLSIGWHLSLGMAEHFQPYLEFETMNDLQVAIDRSISHDEIVSVEWAGGDESALVTKIQSMTGQDVDSVRTNDGRIDRKRFERPIEDYPATTTVCVRDGDKTTTHEIPTADVFIPGDWLARRFSATPIWKVERWLAARNLSPTGLEVWISVKCPPLTPYQESKQ